MRNVVKSVVVAVGCTLAWIAEMAVLVPILCALLCIDYITNRNKQ